MHGDVINPEEKILTPATTWAGGGLEDVSLSDGSRSQKDGCRVILLPGRFQKRHVHRDRK